MFTDNWLLRFFWLREIQNLSHLVFVELLNGAQLTLKTKNIISAWIKTSKCNLEVDADLEIQVSDIPGVWLHGEDSSDLLSLLAGDVIVQIENGLGNLNIITESSVREWVTQMLGLVTAR